MTDVKSDTATVCGMSQAAQKESLHSIPQGTGNHKNPDIMPIASKAMTGGNLN